jgi:GNAT acetyltransferase
MPLVALRQPDLERVKRLVTRGIGHVTFSLGVLERRMPGQVWVDDPSAPRTAVVMSDADFCLAFGEPQPELVRKSLPAMIAGNHAEKPELWATTDEWAAALSFLGEPRKRNEYHFTGLPSASARPLPAGYRLIPIDVGIARMFQGAVDPWVVNAVWGGPERFVEQAFGWAVLTANGALASFCTVCAIGGGEAEVEIGTNPAHRRRGLALATGARFIEDCLARGLTPAWTCATGNAGSERLADLLGFRFTRTITGFPLR